MGPQMPEHGMKVQMQVVGGGGCRIIKRLQWKWDTFLQTADAVHCSLKKQAWVQWGQKAFVYRRIMRFSEAAWPHGCSLTEAPKPLPFEGKKTLFWIEVLTQSTIIMIMNFLKGLYIVNMQLTMSGKLSEITFPALVCASMEYFIKDFQFFCEYVWWVKM